MFSCCFQESLSLSRSFGSIGVQEAQHSGVQLRIVGDALEAVIGRLGTAHRTVRQDLRVQVTAPKAGGERARRADRARAESAAQASSSDVPAIPGALRAEWGFSSVSVSSFLTQIEDFTAVFVSCRGKGNLCLEFCREFTPRSCRCVSQRGGHRPRMGLRDPLSSTLA